MAVPTSSEARLFVRCATQRYEEAQILLKASKPTGAVYIAGYGVECILKALILASVPAKGQPDMMRSFRGNRAHDYGWLRDQYAGASGLRWPPRVAEHFTLVDSWSTRLRYEPSTLPVDQAEAFLAAAAGIINWAKERL